MRKSVVLLALFLMGCSVSHKNAVLHISLANSKASSCRVWLPAEIKNGSFDIPLTNGKKGEYTFNLSGPCFVNLYFASSDDGEAKRFRYVLYLSPGDDLELKADFGKIGDAIMVTGKGSNNNQPLLSMMEDEELQGFYGDTLPGRVINKLNAEQRIREGNLEKYIALYKPSADYISAYQTNLPYIIANNYYGFKENNKFRNWGAWKRNYNKWQKVTDSLFAIAKLNNDDALGDNDYDQLIGGFMYRERERLWSLEDDKPEAFYKEWYNTDTVTGKAQFKEDRHNLVQEKIINRYFSGRSAEYLYAFLMNGANNESASQNIPEIFERFKNKYPHSVYIPLFAPSVAAVIAKRKLVLNDKMIFVADNGVKLNTLEDVSAAMKGKTVLVDMWGTWCGPCREEIEKHSASLRKHFKGKGLTYLYIANYDLKNVEQWKKLIAYFDIEGEHMLANDSLTKNIMAKVKGTGFPTTFIIKKDGTIDQSKIQYPINEDILIGQLEADLKE